LTDTAEIYKGATFKFPSLAKDESITKRKKRDGDLLRRGITENGPEKLGRREDP